MTSNHDHSCSMQFHLIQMEIIFAEESVERIHQPDNFIAAMIQRMMMSILLTMLLHNFVILMNDDAYDEIIVLTATVHCTIRGTLL